MDTPKEIFLKDYKMPDYYFDTVCMQLIKLEHSELLSMNYACFLSLTKLPLQVDLKFSLGEEKTIVSSKITVFPRVEGNILVILYICMYVILQNAPKHLVNRFFFSIGFGWTRS